MHDKQVAAPDNTAVRVALWRALHVEVDSPPPVFEDEVGLKLAAPDDGWRSRPDMSPFTRPFRASIVARARFIEDLVAEQAARGVGQYVILGAGLDTFAQRRPEIASRLLVFEIDQQTGKLTLVEHVSTAGNWPRNFTIDPSGGFLLVANQRSDNVVVFSIDPSTGRLKPTGVNEQIPSPVCLRFL